ncbi:DUF397 domain-containing protein [Streptomyces sp. NRRL F-5123]|uniref:DUF397 domain-containing protein n=1 Tax=Streptomyces sp. NRRL F-5123 TaxID=1463856 RepID=UPI0004E199BD|nr:DUF397 domain-containing protein [Streptomyces sp. NRRL F-5123]
MNSSPMTTWRKSSYSGSTNDCIEVADDLTGVIPVPDSKDPQGPTLAFSPEAWSAFVAGLKRGDFSVA